MIGAIAGALLLAWWIYASHPAWFRNHSVFQLPEPVHHAALAPTVVPSALRPSPTPVQPRVGMTLHLDDIWVTPLRLYHSQGAGGNRPNLGDEFLIVHLLIRNRSQFDYQVQTSDFQVLDSQGQLDPPLEQNFTLMRLREVKLIPGGHTEGTLVFETPLHDAAARLIYEPDQLDPTKRKEWLLR